MASLSAAFLQINEENSRLLRPHPSMLKAMTARRFFQRTLQAFCAVSMLSGTVARAEGPKEVQAGAVTPAVEPVSLQVRLERLRAKGPKHLKPLTPVREEGLSPGVEVRREVVVSNDRCYHVLLSGESADTEIEAELADAQGTVLVREKGKQALALPGKASFCPQVSGALVLKLRAASETRVAFQLVGGENPKFASRFPVGGEGKELVAIRMREIHKNRAAQAAVMAFEHGTLETAGEHKATFEAEGGTCYLLVATGVPSLRALDLEVFDHRGNAIAHSEQQTSIATLKVCADLSGTWTLRARAFKGYGAFGLQAFVAAP